MAWTRKLDLAGGFGNSARVVALNSTERNLLYRLLKQTSRSFYLTLRILPEPVRHQIGLAYLLARATDTIADTEIIPLEKRLAALEEFCARAQTGKNHPLSFGQLAAVQTAPGERLLLEQREFILTLLHSAFAPADQKLIVAVLTTIASGQELDLQRFAGATAQKIIPLKTDAELDDYTYRVAGCVGEFWTHMCRRHLFPEADLDEAKLSAEGIRFGKGLQLVNILRDLPADLKHGRCYVPSDALASIGLQPADLMKSGNEPKFRSLYQRYLDLAEAHLAAGWEYTNTIPRNQIRIRLACAWPILIGLQTLRRLRTENVLDAHRRVKITRAEVRTIMVQTVVRYPFPHSWRALAQFSR